MKSLVHCALQAILNGTAKIAKVWEPPTACWNKNERAYRIEPRMPSIYYPWESMWEPHYPHKDYFDTPVLELYGDLCQEGVLAHVYQRVKHLIIPPHYQQVSAFNPFFDGSFSYSVQEWCRMMYPAEKGLNDVPQEVLDKMAATGCFGNGWLDHKAVLYPKADLSMKKEFEFKKHKPNSKRKHYFTHRSQ